MEKTSSFLLIKVITAVVIGVLFAALILLQVTAQTQEADLAKALRTFETIRRAAERYLHRTGELNKDIWTPDRNPCNPRLSAGTLSWSGLGLENPHSSDSKWYYILYIERGRSFSIGATSKDCVTQFFEVVHAAGNTEWNCAENAGMRPLKEKDGTVTGCTYL